MVKHSPKIFASEEKAVTTNHTEFLLRLLKPINVPLHTAIYFSRLKDAKGQICHLI